MMSPMLRPIYLDFLDILLPLAAGMTAFACGCYLHRLAPAIFRGVISLAVLVVLFLGFSTFLPFPEAVHDVLWRVGGETVIACAIAMLFLGIVFTARGRSTSSGFLQVMA